MKKRNKYLLKNTLIFTIGNFASKFIVFFLIPLYTNVLSTSDYGTADMITTICTVLVPLFSFNISEAIMRFSLDKNEDNLLNRILKIANASYIISSVLGVIIIPILYLINYMSDFSCYILFYYWGLMGSQIYLAALKGQEKLKLYTFGNVLHTFLIAMFNIVFLCGFKMGLNGYLLAYIISNFIITVYAFITSKSYKSGIRGVDKKLLKKMIKYSSVLMPTTFMWWIMNSSDRIMVTKMISPAANGIYAISYKLPTLISTIISIFTQAWLFSAISEKDSSDKEEYTNGIFKYLFAFSSIICMGLLFISKPFMKVYVSSEFYSAWKYIIFLAIGVVFQSLATFVSTSYNVYKDNKGFLFSALCGAILNIILNFVLIPKFQIYGAAVATCISYIAVFIYRIIDTRKYVKINVLKPKYILSYIVFFVSFYIMNLDYYISEVGMLIALIVMCCIYITDFRDIINKLLKKVRR